MSEEILPNEDRELLRRKLEQLKQEYERTAERLQRAEHHDAIRRVSDQIRLTQIDSSQTSEVSSVASSMPPSQYSENHQHPQLQSSIYGFSAGLKIPAIQLQLAEIASTPSLYSPTCKRSPSHRLRSKRSRLRLQNKERESDTDISQENVHERENTEIKESRECPYKENSLKSKRKEVKKEENHCEIKKEPEIERMPAEMKSHDQPMKVRKNVKKLPVVSSEENELEIQNVDSSHKKELVKEKSQPGSALSTQTSFFTLSSGAVQPTDKSEVMLQQTNQSLTDSNKVRDDRTDTKHSSSGILDSCTLVEGLPFPVEYYIRTTRRMAASHSSVDLDAVIYSQLTGGRGRRRLSQSQVSNRGPVTPEHSEGVCRSNDRGRGRGRGRRGRRGRRRSTVGRASSNKALDSTISSDSQADLKSESHIESPSQSELVIEGSQIEPQPIQLGTATASLKPSPEQGVTQDFKHLPDSQLRLDSQPLLDSNLYPIFRRTLSQSERESQTGANKDDQSPLLPSLPSLIRALQEKDTNTGLLTTVDIQDFHLPDEEFGQLKLKRLHLSTSVVEPFIQCPQVYTTRQSRRCKGASGNQGNCEARYSLGELFTPEPMTNFSLEESLPLCQSDPADQSHTEMQNGLNIVNLMDSRQLAKTEPVKCLNNKNIEALLESSETNMIPEKNSLSPVILELSPSLTTHTQKVLDPILPSLGTSPHFLTAGSPLHLRSPLFSSSGILNSPSSVTFKACVSPESVPAKKSGNIQNSISTRCANQTKAQGNFGSQTQNEISEETLTKAQNDLKLDTSPQNNTALGYERLNSSETTKRESLCISENEREHDSSFGAECENKNSCTPENECQLLNIPELESPKTDLFESELKPKIQIQSNTEAEFQTFKCSGQVSETQNNVLKVKSFHCGNESGAVGQTPIEMTSSTNRRAERTQSDESNTNSSKNRTLLHEGSDTVLQEMHTFKALEGGCVLDLCSVRWPSEDLCVCVAGERIVCLWAQMKGDQTWSLIHTWTFAQSIMSLQEIPDSSGLLCVTLGHLEITEARALCCPSMDGPFSQNVVYKDTLQALVGVSNCRLAYCTALGDQQRVCVLTLTQEGRVLNTLPLVSVKQNIRNLAVVEGEKDALIGWTECQTLFIWNVKSGQLLQTIYMDNTLTMTNCMKGYSYRGVLCVLLQDAGNVCDEESNTTLFTLIATNPLTGKHITLTSINYPERQLIDGDVSGSGIVGVFQSGHLAVWDLRGSVAKVVGVLDELCRLARWAGPDTLLTGCLNGDVSVFHYKSS